jgi:hypothetical protein
MGWRWQLGAWIERKRSWLALKIAPWLDRRGKEEADSIQAWECQDCYAINTHARQVAHRIGCRHKDNSQLRPVRVATEQQ